MRILGFLLTAALFLSAMSIGGTVALFIDPPAILIVLGSTVGAFLIAAGPRSGLALRTALGREPTRAHGVSTMQALRAARYGALAGGLLNFMAGLILVLAHVDNPSELGRGMATGLVGILAGIALAYFVLLPLQSGIERQLADQGIAEMAPTERGVDVTVLASGLAFVGVAFAILVYSFGAG